MSDDPRLGLPSASSFDADVACFGRRNLIKHLVDTGAIKLDAEPDEDALRGIKIHAAWQTGNVSKLEPDEFEDYTQGLKHIDDVIARWKSDRGLKDCNEMPREQRLWLHDESTMEPALSGQLDRWYLSGRDALVIDGKSGWAWHISPSERSWQLRVYAVLVFKDGGVKRVRVAFVKPKVKSEPTDWTDYTENDLVMSYSSISWVLWNSKLPDAPRSPGAHCRFCPARAHCPQAAAMSLLPTVALGLSKPEKKLSEAEVLELVLKMSPADAKKLWEMSGVITKIVDANKHRLKTMTDKQREDIGLQLGKGRELHTVENVGEAFHYLWKKQGFTPDELWPIVKMANTAAIELVKTKFNKTADEAAAWLWQQLKPWTREATAERPIRRLKE